MKDLTLVNVCAETYTEIFQCFGFSPPSPALPPSETKHNFKKIAVLSLFFLIIAFPASFQNGSTNGSVPDWGRWGFFAYFWVRYSQMIPKRRKWRRENLKAKEERWGKVGGKPLGEAINLQAKMG